MSCASNSVMNYIIYILIHIERMDKYTYMHSHTHTRYTDTPAPYLEPIRPDQSEQRVHAAALRHQFGLDCQLEYRELPVCTGYTDEGAPIVELVAWPFVMPHTLVAGLYISSRKVSKKKQNLFNENKLLWGTVMACKLHCTSNLVRS